jgi:quercetin dioxygenase-like cupin family protein
MRAVYIYTGPDGHSQFKDGYIHNQTKVNTISTQFTESPAYSHLDWHNAPCSQFVITLKGTLEFTTHSGQSFIIKPGDVLIATDVTGSGHKWRLIDDEPWQRVYCIFIDTVDIHTIFKELL